MNKPVAVIQQSPMEKDDGRTKNKKMIVIENYY